MKVKPLAAGIAALAIAVGIGAVGLGAPAIAQMMGGYGMGPGMMFGGGAANQPVYRGWGGD